MKEININEKTIGGNETFIIAEIGSNHNQDFDLALKHIDAAVESGADAVKFQSLNVGELYFEPSSAIKSLHNKIDMQEDWCEKLKKYADDRGVIFFSSPCYFKSLEYLEKIGVSLYKLASAQIGTFPQLVSAVSALNKPTIISTGLTSLSEIGKVLKKFDDKGNSNVVILHCNSIYPTPYSKVNLKMLDIYQSVFGKHVGFSDHTLDIYVPIAAVARGAKVIEKHFTLSRNLPVPDASFSLEPDEFKKMVEGIRATEQALIESPRIIIEPEEQAFKNSIIYRLVLIKSKRKGDCFKESDFEFKRNPRGIDCRDMDHLILLGRAANDISNKTLLEWQDVVFK